MTYFITFRTISEMVLTQFENQCPRANTRKWNGKLGVCAHFLLYQRRPQFCRFTFHPQCARAPRASQTHQHLASIGFLISANMMNAEWHLYGFTLYSPDEQCGIWHLSLCILALVFPLVYIACLYPLLSFHQVVSFCLQLFGPLPFYINFMTNLSCCTKNTEIFIKICLDFIDHQGNLTSL